ncbi:hypothetical protein B4U80_11693 [Leptotrombidium deliense]|uniref:Uncharacterized protein n=1 Tax=Leptotrombidium deliense TaxID=299467 RepID=A0A443S3N9_9ACAR|nr:hypothetical protein B4U80_11693 [Leptotrombidium deliense]
MTPDLFVLRLVSRDTKTAADFVLKSRCESLVIGRKISFTELYDNSAKDKLFTIISMYKCAKKVELKSMGLSLSCVTFENILIFCKQNLEEVESLHISDQQCNTLTYGLIPKCFPCLKQLRLDSLQLNDEHVAELFDFLPYLERIIVHYVDITGSCFKNMGEFVCSVEWFVNERSFNPNFPFSVNVRDFCFFGIHADGQCLIEMVTDKMRNLERLDINCQTIYNVDSLYLDMLEELTLNVEIFKCIASDAPIMNRLTTLKLCANFDTKDLIVLLMKFPNIEKLWVESKCCTLLSSQLINALKTLRFLWNIWFTDVLECASNYMFEEDGVKTNGLIVLVESLHFVQELKWIIKYYGNEAEYSQLFDECKEIREKTKKNQVFWLSFVQETSDE